MTRFWTSDLHFGHENIRHFCDRPYGSVDEMNEDMIRIWNETVDVNDDVTIVGDFALGKIADTLPLAGLLNGRKVLICGNHDRPWDGHKKKGNWYEKYLDAGFVEVLTGYDSAGVDGVYQNVIGDTPVDVCHFPYSGDHTDEDRYADWRPINNGKWLIHGHIHDLWNVRGRQINVGWDIHHRPITDKEILNIMEESGL